MGLSGNTRKTKIPDDPRNTKWSTDTSAPGYKLLSSMGWTPAAPSLGLAASQELITQGGSLAFSKKISMIPIAKSDNLGIGARGGAGIGSMRAMGLPATGGMGMGFVTAAVTNAVPVEGEVKKGGGGEFGRLLERLNAASASSQSPSPAPEEVVEVVVELSEKAARKLAKAQKKEKKELKRRKAAGKQVEAVIAVGEVPVIAATPILSTLTAILRNPRMAARSKHLRAKRMAASDATAMAEILGIAPPASPSVSGSASPAISHQGISSASIPPVSFTRQVVEPIINGPKEDGWPTAPPRSFPTFASSSSTGLAATFVEPIVVAEVMSSAIEGETEKQKEKREKKERKELKKKGKEVAAAVVEVVPTPKAFPMFGASSTAGLAATFDDSPAVVESAKKEKKKRSRSDDAVVDGAVEVDEAERKRAKKARKAEKKAAKE